MTELDYCALVYEYLFSDPYANVLESAKKVVRVDNSSRGCIEISTHSFHDLKPHSILMHSIKGGIRLDFFGRGLNNSMFSGKIIVPLDLSYIDYTRENNGNAENPDIKLILRHYLDYFNSDLTKDSPIFDFIDYNFKIICEDICDYNWYDLDALNETLDKILYFDSQDMERKARNLKLEALNRLGTLAMISNVEAVNE